MNSGGEVQVLHVERYSERLCLMFVAGNDCFMDLC